MPAAESLSLSDVERLLGLMKAHSVVLLEYRGLKVQRVPDVSTARPERMESELEMLTRKPPDSIDAALMLRRTKGGV